MQFFLVLSAALCGTVFSAPADPITGGLDNTANGLLDLLTPFNPLTDTVLRLFTRSNPTVGQTVVPSAASLDASNFNAEDPTRFIIHGWTNDGTSEVNTLIRDAYLTKDEFNVIVVDWKNGAAKDYLTSSLSTAGVGQVVADMIDFLRAQYPDLPAITVIGHSLGAQTAGFAGRKTASPIDAIVSLDPANPLFSSTPLLIPSVSSSDAIYVQSIQTNRGGLGQEWPCGHATFYPNYGPDQLGCNLDINCSHGRAFRYFAESINAPATMNFEARLCRGYTDIAGLNCVSSGPKKYMGGEPLDTSAVGVYHMATWAAAPFAKGVAGA